MSTNGASRCEQELFSEEDFKKWLKKNGRHLLESGFDPDEIAHLAIYTCQFSPEYVYRHLSHFTDALLGSSFDNKVTMKIDMETWTIEKLSGKVDLDEQWRHLVKKIATGRDFDE